jgi:hypothetical protein
VEAELSLQDARILIDSGAVDQTIGSEDGTSLTKESTTRRDESGRFTSSDVGQKFGMEGLEADAGYVPLSDIRKAEGKTYGGDPDPLEKAFGDLEASGAVEPEQQANPVQWYKTDGSGDPLEPNVTTTVEHAAEALTDYQANVARYVDGMEIDAFREMIDQSRAELLKNDPKAAELYGLDPKEVEANALKETADVPAPEAQAQQSTEIEGSDEELTRALKHPRIAEAVTSEWDRADAARQQYANALNYVNQLAQANLVDHLPELARLPIEQWEGAIVALAQQDPQRVQRALAPLQRVNQLQVERAQQQAQHQQYQQALQYQQFENEVNAEDARLIEMVGSQKAADEANRAMIDHLVAQGVPRNQIFNALMQNPVLRTAEARQTAWKAQQYDRLMAAPKAVPVRQPQNVQRPGSSAPRSTSQNSSLAALNRQLDNATTEAQQLKIARQILEIRGAA